jgi:hypothetical protein
LLGSTLITLSLSAGIAKTWRMIRLEMALMGGADTYMCENTEKPGESFRISYKNAGLAGCIANAWISGRVTGAF